MTYQIDYLIINTFAVIHPEHDINIEAYEYFHLTFYCGSHMLMDEVLLDGILDKIIIQY